MKDIKHLKKIKFIKVSNLVPKTFFMINILFFFGLNGIIAQELESDLILAKKNISVGKLAEAELILNEILKKDPSYAPAYLSFSKIWMLKADIRKATENANIAVRIDEDFRPWWDDLNDIRKKIQIGTSNVKNQNYVVAEEIFSALIKEFPAYPEVHYYLGMAKYKQQDYYMALGHFNKALDLFPDYSKAQKALVNVKKRIKK